MDQESVKEAIKELKEVVLEFHRVAGNLDDIIQSIEQGLDEYPNDAEYFEMLVRCSHNYRNHYVLDKLPYVKEGNAWGHLIEASKVKKES